MISAFASTWKVPELRERILFTLAMIVIIRLGVHVTLPGVDASVIAEYLHEVCASAAATHAPGWGQLQQSAQVSTVQHEIIRGQSIQRAQKICVLLQLTAVRS